MLILRGASALSDFRIQKLVQELVSAGVPVRGLHAEFLPVAELSAELDTGERDVVALQHHRFDLNRAHGDFAAFGSCDFAAFASCPASMAVHGELRVARNRIHGLYGPSCG